MDSIGPETRATETPPPGRNYLVSVTLLPEILMILDVLLIVAAALLPFVFYVPNFASVYEYYIFSTAIICVFSTYLLSRAGMYEIPMIMRPLWRSDLIVVSIISGFLFFLTIAFSLKVTGIYSRIWLYSFAILAVIFVLIGRYLAGYVLLRLARRGAVGRSMVVLGAGLAAERFIRRFSALRSDFTELSAVYHAGTGPLPAAIAGHPVSGDALDLIAHLRRHPVDDIVLAVPWNTDDGLHEIVEQLRELPVNIYVSAELAGHRLQFCPAIDHPRDLPLLEVVKCPISGWSRLTKLLEDYILASVLILILSPLLLLIAIAIKLDSPGPVFFMQRRLGFNNQEFAIYKFRSMYHRDVPETRVQQAQREDPRITRVGKFIRRTSLDELPQLLNVLNGTMSIVGPRPHALSHNADYGARIRGYFARHKVKPGITGWAQVNNLRGETETLEKMEARVEHDIYYTENWSLMLDLKIIVMTVFVVLFHKNAY